MVQGICGVTLDRNQRGSQPLVVQRKSRSGILDLEQGKEEILGFEQVKAEAGKKGNTI